MNHLCWNDVATHVILSVPTWKRRIMHHVYLYLRSMIMCTHCLCNMLTETVSKVNPSRASANQLSVQVVNACAREFYSCLILSCSNGTKKIFFFQYKFMKSTSQNIQKIHYLIIPEDKLCMPYRILPVSVRRRARYRSVCRRSCLSLLLVHQEAL